jgi:hypothetical protein
LLLDKLFVFEYFNLLLQEGQFRYIKKENLIAQTASIRKEKEKYIFIRKHRKETGLQNRKKAQ